MLSFFLYFFNSYYFYVVFGQITQQVPTLPSSSGGILALAKAQLSRRAEEEDVERAAERAAERLAAESANAEIAAAESANAEIAAAESAAAERAAAEETGEYINQVSFI